MKEHTPLVLVVDDFADNREMYADYLGCAGLRTITACDGGEAIRKAEAELPDVIAMDLSLPGMDGCDATRHLKANPKTQHIYIIAITGHAEPRFMKRAQDAGCDHFLAKPCLPQQLLDQVMTYLPRHRQPARRSVP